MATTVIHVRDADFSDLNTVYIGRANRWKRLHASAWANPYRIGESGNRDEVIALYRRFLLASPTRMAVLSELRGKRLACWCAPAPCHGDVLAELADAAATPREGSQDDDE